LISSNHLLKIKMNTKYNFYKKFYHKPYFDNFKDLSYKAGQIILRDLYKDFQFKSVVDFGCGTCGWLKAASELNSDIKLTGIDGHYIKDILDFDKAKILYKNLEDPVEIERHDLAISLETAEHLSPQRAYSFVKDLCKSADVVFFSAAVDGHGGANHLNEKTQSYWVSIFRENDYEPFIFLDRKKYWFHKSFERCPYYISGSFLFIKKNTKNYDLLKKYKINDDFVVDIVHPNILKWRKDENFGVIFNIKRTFFSMLKLLKRVTRRY
jgi:SAM-dependent methyltransferase